MCIQCCCMPLPCPFCFVSGFCFCPLPSFALALGACASERGESSRTRGERLQTAQRHGVGTHTHRFLVSRALRPKVRSEIYHGNRWLGHVQQDSFILLLLSCHQLLSFTPPPPAPRRPPVVIIML